MNDAFSHEGDGREKIGDDGCSPVAHLPPRQDIAEEGGHHEQNQQNNTENPEHFARAFVRAVIKSPQHVNIDDDKEE